MADPTADVPDQRTIANRALLLLGSAKRIDTLDDRDSPDAESLIILWATARRSALALYPFKFALTRETLNRDPQVADCSPVYRFKKPPSALRWLPWERDDRRWFDGEEEGQYLLSDCAGPITARFIQDVPNVALWSPLFVDVMAHQLAYEFCQGKTQLTGLRDRLKLDRDGRLGDAKAADGKSTPQRRAGPTVRQSRWAGARYRPNGAFGR